MIHIYTGDGKGKTTAAMGLALRAINAGQKVYILQFLKGRESGEITVLKTYDQVKIVRGKPGLKFSFQMSESEKLEVREIHDFQLTEATNEVMTGNVGTLILDEVLGALSTGLLDESVLDALLESVPKEVEVVLTGRGASQKLIDRADYVTEMKSIKHPYERGQKMRKGVEY